MCKLERQVEVRVSATPTRAEWAPLLDEHAHQIDDGRIHEGDLTDLGDALARVLDAYGRRPFVRDRRRGRGSLHLL